MKVKTHLRVAYDKKRRASHVIANVNPSTTPISNSKGDPLPTVAFAIVLDIPDEMFRQAEQIIAEIQIPADQAQIAADVIQMNRPA